MRKAFRIGITGPPGVGKSTFIEALGMRLVEEHRVAVLAVDPSSPLSGGSILGDKTRMERLSLDERAYVRPSPSGNVPGGVARATRLAVRLCEGAGFDRVIVETVGVGQSEVAVHELVDCLVLLAQSGAGDELQGIKRGTLELADLVVVPRLDREPGQVRETVLALRGALRYLAPTAVNWRTPVLACSSLTGEGIEEVYNQLEDFHQRGYDRRLRQEAQALDRALDERLRDDFLSLPGKREKLAELRQRIEAGELSLENALEELMHSDRPSA